MAPSTTVRCFVALPLPDGVREALAEHLRACAALAPGHRWSPPQNLHVTLRFLGRVDVVLLDRLRDALGEVRASPFRVALGGEGRFGRPSAPRVLWLGVREGAAPLAEL
ncbi:MAG: RNA 2',3'-cyclic phosphodiesterase, partial [Candidatus Dormiibacterota bacterium]